MLWSTRVPTNLHCIETIDIENAWSTAYSSRPYQEALSLRTKLAPKTREWSPQPSETFVTPQETLLVPWLVGESTNHLRSLLGFGAYFPEVEVDFGHSSSTVRKIVKSSFVEAPVFGLLGKGERGRVILVGLSVLLKRSTLACGRIWTDPRRIASWGRMDWLRRGLHVSRCLFYWIKKAGWSIRDLGIDRRGQLWVASCSSCRWPE